MRLLLVEDDPVLSRTMAQGLENAGHRVELAHTVEEAQHWWAVQAFDAVLLDLNLPHAAHARSDLGSGLTALRAARARGDRTPVLVLSARDSTEERIAGLDAGADDYLGKPYELKEVEARLRALLRRASGTADIVTVGQLVLDRQARRVSVAGQPLELPAREFDLLVDDPTRPCAEQGRPVLAPVGRRRGGGRKRAGGLVLAPAAQDCRQRCGHPHAARTGLRARG